MHLTLRHGTLQLWEEVTLVWPSFPLIWVNQVSRVSRNTDVHTAAYSTLQNLRHFVKRLQCKFSVIHRYGRFYFSARLVTVKCGLVRGNLSIFLKINLHLFSIHMLSIFQQGNLIWTGWNMILFSCYTHFTTHTLSLSLSHTHTHTQYFSVFLIRRAILHRCSAYGCHTIQVFRIKRTKLYRFSAYGCHTIQVFCI